jgi:hypothetical protein
MSTEVLWNPHLPYHSSLTGQSAQGLADEYEKSTGKQWTAPLGIGHSLFEVGIGALKAAAEPKNNKSVRESIATLNIDTVLGPLYFGKSPNQERRRATADRRTMAQNQIRQIQIRTADRQRRHIECETGRRIQAVVATPLSAAFVPRLLHSGQVLPSLAGTHFSSSTNG